MATAHRKPGLTETIEERRTKIWELRKAGASYRKIAKSVGASPQTVADDISAVMGELHIQQLESAEEYRQLELERLDALQLAHWAYAVGSPATQERQAITPDIRAARLILKISDQRSKLLGIYKGTGRIDIIFITKIIRLIEARGGDPISIFQALFETLEGTPFLSAGDEDGGLDLDTNATA